jgi:hypothetical protein
MTKLAILICAFYNKELLDRTLTSIYLNASSHDFDIFFLENPSERSDEICTLKKKYPNINYYICQENIDIGIFDAFSKYYMKTELKKYDYITICEGDMVLDKNAIDECIGILDNNSEVGLCSVKTHKDLEKYKKLQHLINKWIPTPRTYKNFLAGETGLQFLTFKTDIFYDFLENVHKFPAYIAATNNNTYVGINDNCIKRYCEHNNIIWGQTINTGLDHTGWELFLTDKFNYFKKREEDIKNKKIRVSRSDYSIYDFTLLENK